MTPQTDNLEAMVRNAWEAGFSLAVNYGDNHIHCQGDQRERQWKAYWNAARSLAPSSAVVEATTDNFVEVASLASYMTEAIWPRVKGIEQYELSNLAERCIYKGIELGKRSSSPSVEPTVDEQKTELQEAITALDSLTVKVSDEEIDKMVLDDLTDDSHVGLGLTHEGALAIARTFLGRGLRIARDNWLAPSPGQGDTVRTTDLLFEINKVLNEFRKPGERAYFQPVGGQAERLYDLHNRLVAHLMTAPNPNK